MRYLISTFFFLLIQWSITIPFLYFASKRIYDFFGNGTFIYVYVIVATILIGIFAHKTSDSITIKIFKLLEEYGIKNT
jgi:hypothetical protein